MDLTEKHGPSNTWPTPQELALNSSDVWRCQRCGCRDWRVADSRLVGATRNRQRVCRNCATPLPTQEIPVPKGFRIAIVPDDEGQA